MPGGRIYPGAPMSGPPALLWLAWVCAAAAIIYVVGAPFWAAEYPMMTDFPFHASSSSVFRHYLDKGWHFHEQFVFQLFAVPYVTFYAIAAIFMLALPPIVATKLAAGLMLALLPIGLMVLCWGLRKSPLLGLWGLPPSVVAAVAAHQRAGRFATEPFGMCAALYFANRLARDPNVATVAGAPDHDDRISLALVEALGVQDQLEGWRAFAHEIADDA